MQRWAHAEQQTETVDLFMIQPAPTPKKRKPRRRPFTTWTGSVDGLEHRPTISRRIFAEGNKKGLYVELYVWPTLAEMRATWAGGRGKGQRRRVYGFWKPTYEWKNVLDSLGRKIASKKLGEIHLALNMSTYSTIAHESYHATRYFARRRLLREAATLDEDEKDPAHYHMPEEVNARFMGYLSNEICVIILDHNRANPPGRKRAKSAPTATPSPSKK